MTFNYAPLAATATRLLGEFGKASVSIRTIGVTSSDPAAGTVTTAAPVDTSVGAVEVDFNEQFQPGATINTGDRMYVLDALPGIEDMLIIDSEQWEIVQMWVKKPGDTFIAVFVQVRA